MNNDATIGPDDDLSLLEHFEANDPEYKEIYQFFVKPLYFELLAKTVGIDKYKLAEMHQYEYDSDQIMADMFTLGESQRTCYMEYTTDNDSDYIHNASMVFDQLEEEDNPGELWDMIFQSIDSLRRSYDVFRERESVIIRKLKEILISNGRDASILSELPELDIDRLFIYFDESACISVVFK